MTCSRFHAVSRDPEFLFAQAEPLGDYVPLFRMTEGVAITERYPDDPLSVRVALDPSVQGLRPGSFVGNTGGLMIVSRDVAGALEDELTLGEYEILPFTLVDHKGRDHSQDYVFFNPIGTVDALDLEAAELRQYDDGSIAAVTTTVMSAEKLAAAPDIFRLTEDPYEIFLTERATDLIRAHGFSNATLSPVEVR